MSASSRPTSPASSSARAFRAFTSHRDSQQSNGAHRNSMFPDIFMGGRPRTSSTSAQSRSNGKGKERDPTESMDSTSTGYDPDPFVAPYGSSPHVNFETVRDVRPEIPPNFPRRSRHSILGVASDALNFKFGRRRKSIRQPPPQPMVLSEVIEITASRRDEEDEERERLRDAAAQSIGLGTDMSHKSHTREDSFDEEDELNLNDDIPDEERTVDRHTTGGRSTHGSTISVSMSMSSGPSQPPLPNRRRAGSLALSTQSRIHSTSTPGPSVPPFPSTLSSLQPFVYMSSTFPKHYPPPSLLMLALSKQWRNRYVVLTSPASRLPRASNTPAVSYLHLFKSPSSEEREVERLEINEESVVFIADEEVGGRGSVIKVGGVDVGVMRRELNSEENGQTMMLLQIIDSAESQKWIAAIKAAILAQRSLRSGLGIPSHSLSGSEPRGDMDVMLSMRAQGLLPSPVHSEFPISPPRSAPAAAAAALLNASDPNGSIATSPHGSLRGHPTPKTPQTNAVSALKGLFATRPRSPSRATSIDSERDTTEDSFSSLGNNLMSILRSNGAAESAKSPVTSPKLLPISSASPPRVPPGPILTPLERNLQRKIVPDREREPLEWSFSDVGKENQIKRMSAGSPPLQPPPRKRPWTLAAGPGASHEEAASLYNNGNASMSFGVGQPSEPSNRTPGSPSLSVFSGGSATPEQKPRAPSLCSVSTFASGEQSGLDRSNSNVKRWSRQGVLPKRLTPPAGPPPAPPVGSDTQAGKSPPSKSQTLHPYAAERPPSRSSSLHSPSSPQSFVSAMPTFSKRASSSSGYSVSAHSNSTASTNPVNIPNRPMSAGRMSLPPPPRPAPNMALPPTPSEEPQGQPGSAPVNKSSIRESFTQRALRLSLVPPRDPPSSGLPPRPDEPSYRSHRRSSSNGSNSGLSRTLSPIPGSPIPPGPPHPPPTGPLPPPPASSSPLSRLPSIKQRLRLLSAPASPSPLSSPPSTPIAPIHRPPTPSTPIGEPITTHQNDPDFLLSAGDDNISENGPKTSGLPSMADEVPVPESSPDFTELTSLSPPPRRASRPVAVPDRENDKYTSTQILPEEALVSSGETVSGSFNESLSPPPHRLSAIATEGDDKQNAAPVESPLTLLEQHGSTVSLGIVSI
ncbi:hypothetical protein GLOTRDRAFT_118089 [Gloeophyllum trabeum ATCC 11539]|uniref:PH domain-containing protein n=1 Tax=Gloeophyllum trabeum (strain ATCC 11539 / FP-39264 / Madison 617) TaxID=670483 RepID=S7PTD9_GLOTA|nr:uncharacterized protein GLOTRDRAFT_118089 [Gloeophyllum trabeum ATCC 11539]EPQ51016.1 hypothetical protein GLOTRDRAFT_118089 [Gloeophyllum trabeum ATCC 11539]